MYIHLSKGAIVMAGPIVHTSSERSLTPTPRRLEGHEGRSAVKTKANSKDTRESDLSGASVHV